MGSLLARTLRQSGLPIDEVQQAASWDDAVRVVRRRVPDVAFLDADLPGCATGMDLGTALAVPPWSGVPCVMMLPEGFDAGPSGLDGRVAVRRPFTSAEVRAAVLRVLQLRATRGSAAQLGDNAH
jgi:DNA-binding response OmpR family regulator